MRDVRSWFLVLAAGGCTPAGEDLPALLDTGWFDDGSGNGCTAFVDDTIPADGAEDVFYRDPLVLLVSAVSDAIDVRLTTAEGRDVPVTLEPAADGLSVRVDVPGGLIPDAEHVLQVTDCGGAREVRFRTSELGLPLERGGRTLLRRTYELEIGDADWVEPAGFGPILSGLFVRPILVSVKYADAQYLDWIGGLGQVSDGEVSQDTDLVTWDFPVTSFAEAPYFEVSADQVELDVGGFPLPITDFVLNGTFRPDGSGFERATLVGLGDTRFAGGAVLRPDVPGAICDLGSTVGVTCQPCPDDEPYCLAVSLVRLTGEEVEGLQMVPVLSAR